ncbi:hypothetical protein PFISCL1PPCAC_13395, partial [Pristionchus fissidentatus]
SSHTSEEWAQLFGTRQLALGSWSIIFGMVCLFLYIPAVVVFTRERKLSCYKMMLFHAVVDMCGLFANSILFGILMLTGSVYCSDPIINPATAVIANTSWLVSSITCILLVINRICELTDRTYVFK